MSYVIRRTDTNAVLWDSTTDPTFNGSVGAGQDLVQLVATGDALGPNGGYAPVAFDPPSTPGGGEWNLPMRVTWTFTPAVGAAVSKSADFRSLPGPDADADGVADVADACPAVKGTLANGCLPATETDADRDGVFGAADKCPAADGKGTLDGCPPAAPATPPEPSPTNPTTPGTQTPAALSVTLGVKTGTRFTKAALTKGAPVRLSCTRDGTATLVLRVSKTVAKALRVKSPVLGTAKIACKSGTSATAEAPLSARRAGEGRQAQEARRRDPGADPRDADRHDDDRPRGEGRLDPTDRAGWPSSTRPLAPADPPSVSSPAEGWQRGRMQRS